MKRPATPRQAALIQQGIALHTAGRFPEAERLYQTVLRENPSHPDALNLMGLLAIEASQNDIALGYLRKAVALEPAIAMYRNNLGNALVVATRPEEALPHLERAVALDPGYADAWCNLAKAWRQLGDAGKAIKYFQQALAAAPGFLRAEAALAEIASEQGRFDEAMTAFAQILKQEPFHADALLGLAQARRFTAGDPDIQRFETALASDTLSVRNRAQIEHAYAKICNDLGRYDDAMAHFTEGKRLRGFGFDMELHGATYAMLAQTFTKPFFAERQGWGVADARPVFVVGMPRSGTTLTEQILAGHPKVAGLGELHDLRRIARELGYGERNPARLAETVSALTKPDVEKLARDYLDVFRRAPASALRIVDKSPHNYELLGLIALFFPNAHVIHCRRDPIDNCVAVYMQNFNESHGYNSDLAVLGRYYTAYRRLMDDWKDRLPLALHDMPYEDTVADVERTARALIDFVGLPWDANCLNFHEVERTVRTPSRWQVRQPIYGTSVGRWRRYEKHLGPLTSALNG